MRNALPTLLSAAALLALATAADAEQSTRKQRSNCDSYCQKYPGATERQLKNARAFDKGDAYYEQDPNAHPAGSRSWWFLKDREGAGTLQ